jgi:YVTN family beta-propeller protein
VAALVAILVVAGSGGRRGAAFAAGAAGPTYSSPIAITSDDRFVWVVNPDNDSVSVLEVGGDVNQKVAEIPVGDEPRSIAISPDNLRVFVTNMAGGTVSVIDVQTMAVIRTIPVGSEPFGCALTPDGRFLYVANFSSDSVSVIHRNQLRVLQTISVGPKPRGIAITDGSVGPPRVLVTHFLAQLRPDGRTVDQKEGRDDGKEGRVTIIDPVTNMMTGVVALNPITDTGFLSNGSTLDRIPSTDPPTFAFTTGAFPNLLQSVAVKGGRAYLPNTGSSPNGPFRFNVNVQGLISVIDLAGPVDANQTLNMNRGVPFENIGQRLFNTNPIALAFKRSANEGFAVLAAANRLVRVELDAGGAPTLNAPTALLPPATQSNIIRIPVGANPQGIAINSTDTRAYVMNFISRDVSVVNISGPPTGYTEIARIPSAALPAPGSLEALVLHGHELFNTSIGPAGTVTDSMPPAGRMSDLGWGTCYSCHPDGRTDGVTWMFADGPRQSISMESTAEHPQPAGSMINANGAPLLPAFKQRVLNWSAVRDEIQDFELNIRGVSGGEGLITDGMAVVNLQPTANTGRSADLDNIAAYICFGIRAPISPLRGSFDPDIIAGRALFASANCQQCHGGTNWTRSQVLYTPPPTTPPVTITGGQLVAFLNNVGTFDPAAFNEVRSVGTTVVTANGALGFNVPSLLSVFAGVPYLHSGSATTLDEVLQNVTHRSAGTGGVDTLTSAADRARVVKFLQSIDAASTPFP